MAGLTLIFSAVIGAIFIFDFSRMIMEIRRDRAQMKALRLKAEAGGFGV